MIVFIRPLNLTITSGKLYEMPTLHSGHFSNLKIDTPNFRVWLSRMSLADYEPDRPPKGWPFEFEKLVEGNWVSCDAHGNPL
jgi:hypothetical protein